MALHFFHYNFVRVHQTQKVSPAMAAGGTKRLWEMSDVVDMLEACEAAQWTPLSGLLSSRWHALSPTTPMIHFVLHLRAQNPTHRRQTKIRELFRRALPA
jgi:hypothetical protein